MKVSCSPKETEVRPATQILATAFRDDPFFGVILGGRTPSSWRHRLAYPAFFREAIRDALAGGRVDVARVDGRLADVAAWLRPVAPDDAPAHPRGARLGAAIDRLLVRVSTHMPSTGGSEVRATRQRYMTDWCPKFSGRSQSMPHSAPTSSRKRQCPRQRRGTRLPLPGSTVSVRRPPRVTSEARPPRA